MEDILDNNDMDFVPDKSHFMHEDFVMTVQDCEAVCEHMTHHLIRMQLEDRASQSMLLRDCADICGLTASFAARDAIYARNAAALCADICQSCAMECLRHPDEMSQHCGMVCLNCAKHCRTFASMGVPERKRRRETKY